MSATHLKTTWTWSLFVYTRLLFPDQSADALPLPGITPSVCFVSFSGTDIDMSRILNIIQMLNTVNAHFFFLEYSNMSELQNI